MTELAGLAIAVAGYASLYVLYRFEFPKPRPKPTAKKPCPVEYKVGDVVLAKAPRGKTETLTITDITETYDGTGHHLMSGKQIIPTDHIIGGYRP